MAEWHDDGSTLQENYARAKHQVNQDFDKRLANKSFFTSKSSIEADRKSALSKVETDFYGERRGGCFSE